MFLLQSVCIPFLTTTVFAGREEERDVDRTQVGAGRNSDKAASYEKTMKKKKDKAASYENDHMN
jgi:hypothetical protein